MTAKYILEQEIQLTATERAIAAENKLRLSRLAKSAGLGHWQYEGRSYALNMDAWIHSDGVRAHIPIVGFANAALGYLDEIDTDNPWGWSFSESQWAAHAKSLNLKHWSFIRRLQDDDIANLRILGRLTGVEGVNGFQADSKEADITIWRRTDGYETFISNTGKDIGLGALRMADTLNPIERSAAQPVSAISHTHSLLSRIYGALKKYV